MENDPIIQSMQDAQKPAGSGPAPKQPLSMMSPKKLGDPPAGEKKGNMPPPPPPSPAAKKPEPATPKPPIPPMPTPSRGNDGTPKVNMVLLIVLLLVTGFGLGAIYLTVKNVDASTSGNGNATQNTLEDMQAKLDITIQKIQSDESTNREMQQQLFDTAGELQKAADELVSEGEKLIADGQALKTEGEATNNQDKIARGQNQIDRGTAMVEHGRSYDASGKMAQSDSGMDANK